MCVVSSSEPYRIHTYNKQYAVATSSAGSSICSSNSEQCSNQQQHFSRNGTTSGPTHIYSKHQQHATIFNTTVLVCSRSTSSSTLCCISRKATSWSLKNMYINNMVLYVPGTGTNVRAHAHCSIVLNLYFFCTHYIQQHCVML